MRPVVSRRRVAGTAGTGRSISAGPYGRSAPEGAARRVLSMSADDVSTKPAAMSALCGCFMAIPTRSRLQACLPLVQPGLDRKQPG